MVLTNQCLKHFRKRLILSVPSTIPEQVHRGPHWIWIRYEHMWASLVAQLVKNLPPMRETWVWFLGWEDPLEKRMATHFSILAWRIPWTIQSWNIVMDYTVSFVKELDKTEWLTFHFHSLTYVKLQHLGWKKDKGCLYPQNKRERQRKFRGKCFLSCTLRNHEISEFGALSLSQKCNMVVYFGKEIIEIVYYWQGLIFIFTKRYNWELSHSINLY